MNRGREHTLDFYIKYTPYSSRAIMLPVNPESVTVDNSSLRDVVDMVALGERQIGNGGGLDSIFFETFLPTNASPTYVRIPESEYRGQKYYIDLFKMLDERKSIVDRLILQDTGIFKFSIIDTLNTNNSRTWNCTLDSWSTSYSSYNLNDVTLSVTMREYKNYGAQIASIAGVVDGILRLQ